MKWSIIRPKVKDTIAAIVGIETYWRDRERAFVDPGDQATCLLHIIASGDSPGDDDFRQEFNVGTNLIDVTQAGIRPFTLSILVESFDQSDTTTALEYLEKIRDALKRPRVLDIFREVGLAIRDVMATTDLSAMEDDHAVSSASMDVMFAYANNVKSTDGELGLEPLQWIEKVGGPGTTVGNVTPIGAELDGEVGDG